MLEKRPKIINYKNFKLQFCKKFKKIKIKSKNRKLLTKKIGFIYPCIDKDKIIVDKKNRIWILPLRLEKIAIFLIINKINILFNKKTIN